MASLAAAGRKLRLGLSCCLPKGHAHKPDLGLDLDRAFETMKNCLLELMAEMNVRPGTTATVQVMGLPPSLTVESQKDLCRGVCGWHDCEPYLKTERADQG